MRAGMVAWGLVLGCSNGGSLPQRATPIDPAGSPSGASTELSVTLGSEHRLSVKSSGLWLSARSTPKRQMARLANTELVGDAATPAQPRAVGSGSVEIERGWAVERLQETPAGVEQSWRFESRPERASLRLRIPVVDAELLGSTASGLVFRTLDERYLSYGNGTWVDAHGIRSAVQAHFEHGAIELTLPAELLATSAYPAVLDPVIGVESTLAPDTLVAAEGRQSFVGRIALGASSRLMAWSDGREGIVDGVYFTLEDAANFPKPPFTTAAGRRLGYASLTGVSVTPAVAYAGGQYLVAWASYRTLSWARVAEDGTILDPTAKTLSFDAGDMSSASVAANGSGFMITWLDAESGNGDIRALRVGSDGAALDAKPIEVVSDANAQRAPSIRPSADGCWIVFSNETEGDADIDLVRLLGDGSLIDQTPLKVVETYASQGNPDLAFDSSGKSGLVVWDDSATSAVFGASFSTAAGSVSFGPPARISIGSGERAPRVAYNGSGYQIAWLSAQGGSPAPQVALLASSNPVRADGVSLGNGWSSFVDISARGSKIEALWDADNAQTRSQDVFHKVGSVTNNWDAPGYLVSLAATTQLNPRMANNSSRYLVAWETPRVGGTAIEAARVNPLGEFEDSTPLSISSTTVEQHLAGVYSDDTNFLVVWYERTGNTWKVMGRLVSDSGTPGAVSTPPFRTSSYSYDPADVWIDYNTFPWRYMLTFVDGDVIYNAALVGVQRGTSKFLYENDSVVGARSVRSTGQYVYFLGADGYVHRITNTTDIQGGTGGRFLEIPGNSSSFDVTEDNVVAAFRSDTGTVTIASSSWQQVLATGLLYPANPQVARMPGGYLVSWNQDGGIVGARVTQGGEVMDTQPATLSQEPAMEALGDAYTDFADRCLLTYSRPLWQPGVGSIRVAARPIDFRFNAGSALGKACKSGFDCKSGLCVDGVCCDSACGYSQADCQVCSKTLGASADGVCTVLATGRVCREASGACDLAETCDGTSAACPTDAFASASTACGDAATDDCDKADHCPGDGADCVHEGLKAAGTRCRSARGPCDSEDECDGKHAECSDQRFGSEHLCRAADGACDVPDYCSGDSDDCGADSVKAAATECRAASGICDEAESCDGQNKACPVDAFVAPGTVCRDATAACDLAETCSGDAAACPVDTNGCAGSASGGAGGVAGSGDSLGGKTTGGTTGSDQGGASGQSAQGGSSLAGSAGSSSFVAGSAATNVPPASPQGQKESGCSCRTAGGEPNRVPVALFGLALLIGARRRRHQDIKVSCRASQA